MFAIGPFEPINCLVFDVAIDIPFLPFFFIFLFKSNGSYQADCS